MLDDSNWSAELNEWRRNGGELDLKRAILRKEIVLPKLNFRTAKNYISLFVSRTTRVQSFLTIIDFDAQHPNGVDSDNLPDDYPYHEAFEVNKFFIWYCLKIGFCDRYESTSLLLSGVISSLITEYKNDAPSEMLIEKILTELDDHSYIDFQ